jgi:hypothetical protein
MLMKRHQDLLKNKTPFIDHFRVNLMDTPLSQKRWGVSIILFSAACVIFSGCSSYKPSNSIFLPPTGAAEPTSISLTIFTTPISTIPYQTPPSTPEIVCNDNLLYIEDITFPDSTVISPGSSIDKQWLVQNNGTCNWDYRYSLHKISGDEVGIELEQALFPARAGSKAVIQVSFTAPLQEGTFSVVWQAFDPTGKPFGDSLSILLIVSR